MNSPKKKFQCGGVVATVWENEQTGNEGAFTVESVGFSKRYKRNDGSWDSTNSFRKNDLPKIQLVCQKAYEYLNERRTDQEPGSEPAGT
jgi:hypothetical protein